MQKDSCLTLEAGKSPSTHCTDEKAEPREQGRAQLCRKTFGVFSLSRPRLLPRAQGGSCHNPPQNQAERKKSVHWSTLLVFIVQPFAVGQSGQAEPGMVPAWGCTLCRRQGPRVLLGFSVELSAGSGGLSCRPLQVDELYEGYCIQCRLRDGASNMQRAFSRSPPSRASRESLQELGRSLHECSEVGASPCPTPPLQQVGGRWLSHLWGFAGHVAHRGGAGGPPGRVLHQDERYTASLGDQFLLGTLRVLLEAGGCGPESRGAAPP